MKKILALLVFALTLLVPSAVAIDYEPVVYPAQQTSVGNAALSVSNGTYTFSNNLFSASFVQTDGKFKFGGCSAMSLKAGTELFTVTFGDGTSVKASELSTPSVTHGDLTGSSTAVKGSDHFNGKYLQAVYTYTKGEATLTLTWRAELRDGSHYLRTDLTVKSNKDIAMKSFVPMQYIYDTTTGGTAPEKLGNITYGNLLMNDKIFAGLETPMGQNSVGDSDGETYTAFPNVSNWTKDLMTWTPSSIPSALQSQGGVAYTAANYLGTQGLVTFGTSGSVTATFQYQSGACGLWVAGIELVNPETGTVESSNYNLQFTGGGKQQISYTLANVVAGKVYLMRFYYDSKKEGAANRNTSNGNITWTSAPTAYTPTESGAADKYIKGLWSRNTTLYAYAPDTNGELGKDMEWNVSTVVGLVNPAQKRRSYLAYHERERAVPWRPFPLYNSWYELNINRKDHDSAADNMKTAEAVEVVNQWKQHMYTPFGEGIQAYVWDDGWDEYGTWAPHSNFTDGFAQTDAIAKTMNTGIGCWLGPRGGYGHSADLRRAYWTSRGSSHQLSQPDFFKAFMGACSDKVKNYDFRFFKFDGISTLGTAYGPQNEEDAEGIITVERLARKMREDLFFNTTVGTWASPFWFHFADAIWRQENDHGTIGNGANNREQWITYRDNLVHKIFTAPNPICPINSIMTHGFILSQYGGSSDRSYKSILNELRCAFCSGDAMVELYADAALLNSINGGTLWGEIAKCIKWQKDNADVLPDIHWVGGDPWDETNNTHNIYGWASWNGTKATFTLRNGDAQEKTITLKLRDALDIPASFTGNVYLVGAFSDLKGSLKHIAAINGTPVEDNAAINVDANITFTLPGSSVYVYNGGVSAFQNEPALNDVETTITYNALNGDNSTWSTWYGEVPTRISSLNTSYTKENLRVMEKVYEFTGDSNTLTSTFTYTGGNNRLDIVGVEVLGAGDEVVASSYHHGHAGSPSVDNTYTLANIPAGIYTVRYITTAHYGTESNTNTAGTITNVLTSEEEPEIVEGTYTLGEKITAFNQIESGGLYAIVRNKGAGYATLNESNDEVKGATAFDENGTNTFVFTGDNTNGYTIKSAVKNVYFPVLATTASTGNRVVMGSSAEKFTLVDNNSNIADGIQIKSLNSAYNGSTANVYLNSGDTTDYFVGYHNQGGGNTQMDLYKVSFTPNASLTFDPEKLYTIYEPDGSRGYMAYNPAATTYVGLADVTLSGYTNLHASTSDANTGIAFKIIEEPAGTVKFYCEKNSSYVKLSGTTANSTAQWTTTEAEAATFTFTKEGDNYLFQPTGVSNLYLNPACGWQANQGPVRLGDKETTSDWQVAEYVAPDPYDGKTFIIRHAKPMYSARNLSIADDGEHVGFSEKNDVLACWTFEATGTPGEYKLQNYMFGYLKDTNKGVWCELDDSSTGEDAATIRIDSYTPTSGQDTYGVPNVVTLTNVRTGLQLFNNAESSSEAPKAYLGYGSSTASNSWGCQFIIEEYVAPDASLEMLETPGTYYVYIKDGGKYLHNTDHGAVTATESTERAQNEIERSNAHIWRLVSDGENVTITNGYGNGYNSATPNTITLADVPTTWHLDNIVESKIWNADVRYAEEGCIYYGTMPAYNGGFFATAKSVTTIYPTAGPVEDMYAGTIHNDEDPDSPTLTLRYYTEEERLEMPYLQEQIYNAIVNMYEGSVGYAPLTDEDWEDDEIGEFLMTFSFDPEITGGVSPEFYKEALATFNKLVESKKNDIIMPQAGQAFRLSVRSTDGHNRWYLKNDGGVSTSAADAAVFVMGSTGTEGYGMLFASNDQTNSKYLQYKGATGTAYAENTCDFEIKPMVQQTNGNITADMAHRFGTFSLKTAARPDDAALTGTMILKEGNHAWDKSKDPFMNGEFTSAIEMEEVEYPYTKPNLATGTGDGHTGVWASVWLPFPMNIPDGIEVYKGTQERTVKGEPYLGLTKVDPDTHSCYAAGGYLLYSTTVSAGTIDVLPANSVPTDARETDDAAFVGSTENPGVADDGDEWTAFSANFNGATPYVLANKSNGVGFYKYVGTKMPKGKAIWLKPADSSDAECVKLGFDDIISAIEALHGHTEGVEIFDLQGRRLDKVEKGQINVINGQKIMFK